MNTLVGLMVNRVRRFGFRANIYSFTNLGMGFGVYGSGYRDYFDHCATNQAVRFSVPSGGGDTSTVWHLGCRIWEQGMQDNALVLEFESLGSGFSVNGPRFRVWVSGLRVSGLRFRV